MTFSTILTSLAFSMLLVMVVAICTWMTVNKNLALDDAYITYIYGQHLADGHGLRYNIADALPTEGSSSLLHALMIAGGAFFDVDPLTLSRLASIFSFAFFGLILMHVVSRVSDVNLSVASSSVVVVSFALLFLNETLGHMTKGMETIYLFYLHGAFFSWALYFALADRGLGRSFHILGLVIGVLLIIARPEGFVLLGGLIGAAALARLYILDGFQFARIIKDIAPIAIGSLLFLASYFAWKINYFGDIFPTAYWVKSNNNIFGGDGEALPGLKHVTAFLLFRWVPLALLAFGLLWTSGARRIAVACAVLVIPSLCIALLYGRAIHEVAGGFRYGQPLTAPLFIVAALGLAFHARKNSLRLPAAYLGGVFLFFVFSVNPYGEEFRLLQKRDQVLTGWIDHQPFLAGNSPIASDLAATGLGGEATLLTSAAGVIPYMSKFKTIDWLGLNDEQLSGKYEMSVNEAWAYIEEQAPDVSMSIFPAATKGSESRLDDPGFASNSVRATLGGRGVRLFKHWDRDRVGAMAWKQMVWFRDQTDFAACYPLRMNWAVFVYVKRSSPHYTRLMEAFGKSDADTCDPARIKQIYQIELEKRPSVFQTSAG